MKTLKLYEGVRKSIATCMGNNIKIQLQSTPDDSNLQGKLKKVRVIGSSSYRG